MAGGDETERMGRAEVGEEEDKVMCSLCEKNALNREKSGKGTRLLRINLYICANLIREEYYVYCERWGKRDFRIFVE